MVSANAYLGAEPIADALLAGAADRRHRPRRRPVARRSVRRSRTSAGAATTGTGSRRATMAGHLLECGAQVSGGYYADPGLQGCARPGPRRLSDRRDRRRRPLHDHQAAGTGGRIDAHTVKEQLLYEVHDPAAYLTPDVVADLARRRSSSSARTACALDGVRGHPRPATLKVNVFHEKRLAGRGRDLVRRAARRGARAARGRGAARAARRRSAPLRVDLIGVASVFGDDAGAWLAAQPHGGARDVRLRVAALHDEQRRAPSGCRAR